MKSTPSRSNSSDCGKGPMIKHRHMHFLPLQLGLQFLQCVDTRRSFLCLLSFLFLCSNIHKCADVSRWWAKLARNRRRKVEKGLLGAVGDWDSLFPTVSDVEPTCKSGPIKSDFVGQRSSAFECYIPSSVTNWTCSLVCTTSSLQWISIVELSRKSQ